MTASGPRQTVLDALADPDNGLAPGVLQLGYFAGVDNIDQDSVYVELVDVVPQRASGQWRRAYSVQLLAVVPLQDPQAGADAVDQLLEDVLHAIDLAPKLTWEKATRATLDDTWPAWTVDLVAHTQHTTE